MLRKHLLIGVAAAALFASLAIGFATQTSFAAHNTVADTYTWCRNCG